MPKQKTGLHQVEEQISKLDFEKEILNSIDYSNLIVKLPKFKLDATYELKEVLRKVSCITSIFYKEG